MNINTKELAAEGFEVSGLTAEKLEISKNWQKNKMTSDKDNKTEDCYYIRPVARIYTDFNEKFGIPRQPGLIDSLTAEIVFEPEFRDENAVRCLKEFSHLWLLWGFSKNLVNMEEKPCKWSPLVTPPRLGGKTQVGVFASRSPYRPNSIGLSSVKLLEIQRSDEGLKLIVSGVDILNGTPIYDIKPYIPYSDCHPEANEGYSVSKVEFLKVKFPEKLLKKIPKQKQQGLIEVLSQDPRGAYEKEEGYLYGLSFDKFDIRFKVSGETLMVLDVVDVLAGYLKIK